MIRPPFSFASPLTLDRMHRRLNEAGHWSWTMGDSAWHGDYLGTKAAPQDVVVRLYEDGTRFVLVLRAGKARIDLPALHAAIETNILRIVEATDLQPHEGID